MSKKASKFEEVKSKYAAKIVNYDDRALKIVDLEKEKSKLDELMREAAAKDEFESYNKASTQFNYIAKRIEALKKEQDAESKMVKTTKRVPVYDPWTDSEDFIEEEEYVREKNIKMNIEETLEAWEEYERDRMQKLEKAKAIYAEACEKMRKAFEEMTELQIYGLRVRNDLAIMSGMVPVQKYGVYPRWETLEGALSKLDSKFRMEYVTISPEEIRSITSITSKECKYSKDRLEDIYIKHSI